MKNLKLTQQEVIALLDYMLAEAYYSQKTLKNRFRVPYGKVNENDQMFPDAELIVEVHVYFDGELLDERNEDEPKLFKVTGPNKGSH